MSYAKTRQPDILIARRGYSDQSGIADDIWGGVKSVAGGAVNVIKGLVQSNAAPAPPPPPQPSGMPSWVIPTVAVGAGVLLIALVMRKKRR